MQSLKEQGFIDYKAPIGYTNDFRTSYYRGHKYIPPPKTFTNKEPVSYGDKYMYSEDPIIKQTFTSEFRDNYRWKFPNQNAPIYASVPKIQYMKGYVEEKFKFIPRMMKPITSLSHEHYQWRQESPSMNIMLPAKQIPEPAIIKNKPIFVNPAHPGALKYLDPSATTNRLTYVHRTPTEIMSSIANMDNITVWNWSKVKTKLRNISSHPDAQMCNELPSNLCTKRVNDDRTAVSYIPNRGMTTESRENYGYAPLKRLKSSPEYHNIATYIPLMPFATDTESSIIGSGKRIQQFVP